MSDSTPEDDLREEITTFLRRNFPQINMHGGSAAIEAVDPDEGVVQIRLAGACSGCSISPMTIEAIRSRLPRDVPEVEEVHVSTGVGDDAGLGSGRGGTIGDSTDAPF